MDSLRNILDNIRELKKSSRSNDFNSNFRIVMLENDLNMEFVRLSELKIKTKTYLDIKSYITSKIDEIKSYLEKLIDLNKYPIKIVDKIVYDKPGLELSFDKNHKLFFSIAIQLSRLYFDKDGVGSNIICELIISTDDMTYKRSDFNLLKHNNFIDLGIFQNIFDIYDYNEFDVILKKLVKNF